MKDAHSNALTSEMQRLNISLINDLKNMVKHADLMNIA